VPAGSGAAAERMAPVLAAGGEVPRLAHLAGLTAGVVDSATIANPAGLVPARLAGLDLFIWSDADPGPETVALARTRAAELRSFVAVLPAGESDRAFAVDPDGVVVAGTFGDFRLATFVYDRARTGATSVAPGTDVLAGLRSVAELRERLLMPT
jgi:hypothetical protein